MTIRAPPVYVIPHNDGEKDARNIE
jgi:hypothetical protein